MLPQKHRLTRREDFQRVMRRGSPFSFEDIAVKVVRNNLAVSRFGFAVSSKSVKKAVRRNRLKRVLRGAVNQLLSEIKPGLDVVLFYKGQDDKKQALQSEKVRKLLEISQMLK